MYSPPLLQCTQPQLMAGLRAATAVEAMFTDEDWLRRYHYSENFHPGVDLATFDNGSGDDMHIILSSHDGVIIKGFDHESPVSPYARENHSPWPGIFDGVPAPLLRRLDDPAIRKDDITFLHWLPAGAAQWSRGPVSFPDGEDDGSGWLLRLLPPQSQDYIDVARGYWEATFERWIPPSSVNDLVDNGIRHRPSRHDPGRFAPLSGFVFEGECGPNTRRHSHFRQSTMFP